MPTANRRAFVEQAIRYFHQQDYPNKELVIVDDGDDGVEDLPIRQFDETVRYVRLRTKVSIGEKRNIAVQEGSGELIAHWDDDDWYAPTRLSYQLAPLVHEAAEITGLSMSYIYDLSSDAVWFVDRQLHREMFVGGIHTGSIAYRRHAWQTAGHFPAIDLGEDVAFMRSTVGRGVRLLKLPNDADLASCGGFEDGADLQFVTAMARHWDEQRLAPSRPTCIYVRHWRNTWRFRCGQHLRPQAWHRLAPDRLLSAEDLVFYRAVAAVAR